MKEITKVTAEEFLEDIDRIKEKLEKHKRSDQRILLALIIATLLTKNGFSPDEVFGILELAKEVAKLSYRMYTEGTNLKTHPYV